MINLANFQDLKNKYVLVTGASRGIGEQVTRYLIDIGSYVYGISRTKQSMDHLVAYAKQKNTFFHAIDFDLNNFTNIKKLKSLIPSLDSIVHNAGFFELIDIENISIEQWNSHLNININSPFFLTQTFWKCLKKSAQTYGSSSIVFISSLAGIIHKEKFKGTTPYVVSKTALVGLNEVIASEGREHSIRSNCISPGAVNTKMLRDAFPNMKASFQPSDIASLILYYISAMSSPITGTNLIADV